MHPLPSLGGELGLTNLFDASVCALANHFVNQECFFRDTKVPYYFRNFSTSPLMGSGTTDLIGLQVSPHVAPGERPDIRPILFEHKPFMSFHDLVRLIICLRSDGFQLSFSGKDAKWSDQAGDLSQATKSILLQIVEQMHVHRARYCILGTWDYYLVFYLESRHFISCSNLISRDSEDDKKMFERSVIL